MVAHWPGTIRPGSISNHVSAQWDLFPTFAEIAGAPITEHLDGISFLPTLRGEAVQPQHDYLYWEFHERGGRQAVRRGQWKAVRYDVTVDPNAELELYDLVTDLSEETNVAPLYPHVAENLKRLISEARTPSDNPRFNFVGASR